MFDYAHLNALRAVIRNGSFDAAAASLNVTPSAISQRIKALEEQVGTPLIVRTNPAIATKAGQRLFRHTEEVTMLETTLSSELDSLSPTSSTPIRIVVNADSLDTWFINAMAATHGVLFDISTDDQDFSADWLRRGEVMAAVTARSTPVQGCDVMALGSLRYLATASADFHAQYFGAGLTTDTAKIAPMLKFNQKDDSQNRWLITELGKPISPPVHYLPSTRGFVDAASRGLGWGLNPERLVQDHIDSGKLVKLGYNPVYDVPLYWQYNRVTAKALLPITNAVKQAAKQWLSN